MVAPGASGLGCHGRAREREYGRAGDVGGLLMIASIKFMRSNLDKMRHRGLPPLDASMPRAFPGADPDDCGTSGSIAEEQDCHRPVVLVDKGVSDC